MVMLGQRRHRSPSFRDATFEGALAGGMIVGDNDGAAGFDQLVEAVIVVRAALDHQRTPGIAVSASALANISRKHAERKSVATKPAAP